MQRQVSMQKRGACKVRGNSVDVRIRGRLCAPGAWIQAAGARREPASQEADPEPRTIRATRRAQHACAPRAVLAQGWRVRRAEW